MRKSKVTVKHYLETNLKPTQVSGDKNYYRIYIIVIFRGLSTKFRSVLLEDISMTEEEFNLISDASITNKMQKERRLIDFILNKLLNIHDHQYVPLHIVAKIYNGYFETFYLSGERIARIIFSEFLIHHKLDNLEVAFNQNSPLTESLKLLADQFNKKSPIIFFISKYDVFFSTAVYLFNFVRENIMSFNPDAVEDYQKITEQSDFIFSQKVSDGLISKNDSDLIKPVVENRILNVVRLFVAESQMLVASEYLEKEIADKKQRMRQ